MLTEKNESNEWQVQLILVFVVSESFWFCLLWSNLGNASVVWNYWEIYVDGQSCVSKEVMWRTDTIETHRGVCCWALCETRLSPIPNLICHKYRLFLRSCKFCDRVQSNIMKQLFNCYFVDETVFAATETEDIQQTIGYIVPKAP